MTSKIYAGATDEITTCECCGRSGLKKTIRIVNLDAQGENDGEMFYGSQCAAKAFGGTSKGIMRAAETNAMIAHDALRDAKNVLATLTTKALEAYGTDRNAKLFQTAADIIKARYGVTDDVAWMRGVAYVRQNQNVIATQGLSAVSRHAR